METTTVQQEAMMPAQPQQEHQWLQKLVGNWTFAAEASMGPDQPPEKSSGTEQVRSLGDLWIVAESQGEMPGCGPATMMMTLGYNPQSQRFVGTWIGSMMSYMWVYDGELDAANNVLTLNNEGPSMSGDEKMAKYRDVIEFKDDNHRVMTSYVLKEDGQWHPFMTVDSHRTR